MWSQRSNANLQANIYIFLSVQLSGIQYMSFDCIAMEYFSYHLSIWNYFENTQQNYLPVMVHRFLFICSRWYRHLGRFLRQKFTKVRAVNRLISYTCHMSWKSTSPSYLITTMIFLGSIVNWHMLILDLFDGIITNHTSINGKEWMIWVLSPGNNWKLSRMLHEGNYNLPIHALMDSLKQVNICGFQPCKQGVTHLRLMFANMIFNLLFRTES